MKKWLRGALRVLEALALIAVVVVLSLVMINALPWTFTWDLWAVLTAVGTVGATVIALFLAIRAWVQDKDATARVVSAWVTDEYQSRHDGSSYHRSVQLHIANESNQPVFNAMVNVHIGRAETPLGPLSAPAPISVIPPRRELVFDISIPLLAHTDSWSPKAELTFTDPKGRYWLRDLNGELRDISRRKQQWSKEVRPGDDKQLGDMESPFNPMIVAVMFLAILRDPNLSSEDFAFLLAPEASGWVNADWSHLRQELESYQPTSMVDYPAPRIARVKLSGDPVLEGKTVEGVGRPLELAISKFMTLTLDPHNGWRVFGVGQSVPPDAIHFGGSLSIEVNPYREPEIESGS